MGLVQYLKDTRAELNHVAWPTRVQTMVFTILVIALSIIIAMYLGFFDFIFTQGLAKGIEYLPQTQGSLELETLPATGTPETTEIPASFNLTSTSTQ